MSSDHGVTRSKGSRILIVAVVAQILLAVGLIAFFVVRDGKAESVREAEIAGADREACSEFLAALANRAYSRDYSEQANIHNESRAKLMAAAGKAGSPAMAEVLMKGAREWDAYEQKPAAQAAKVRCEQLFGTVRS